MLSERAVAGFLAVAVGLVLSVVGMVSYTGILDWDIPSAVMYIGYVVTVVGMVLLYLDTKEGMAELEAGDGTTQGTVSDDASPTDCHCKDGEE